MNIEESHLDLLRTGRDSGADWTLILEDDAATTEITDCAAGLAGLMRSDVPAYVNLSKSFSMSALGIEHLLSPVQDCAWAGDQRRAILSSARPATNTVCAILYRTSFAGELVGVMDELPLEPVVPIDWKLNKALMLMHADGRLPAGTCWFVEPGPIDQLSMH